VTQRLYIDTATERRSWFVRLFRWLRCASALTRYCPLCRNVIEADATSPWTMRVGYRLTVCSMQGDGKLPCVTLELVWS
jgi:hypothetical protein